MRTKITISFLYLPLIHLHCYTLYLACITKQMYVFPTYFLPYLLQLFLVSELSIAYPSIPLARTLCFRMIIF